MKITGIEIGEYRQFKNIKFDFTYPEGHPKAGQPLEKVCFIGQSGTGKTTLLNVIWELINNINEAIAFEPNPKLGENFVGEFAWNSIFDIRYFLAIKGNEFCFDRTAEIHKSDCKFLTDWLSKISHIQQANLTDIKKLCIFIKDSISREADAFLADQRELPQTFSDIFKTTTQIQESKVVFQDRIEKAGVRKVISLGDMASLSIWQYLLREIISYDGDTPRFMVNLGQKARGATKDTLKDLEDWLAKNPRIELEKECLSPLLDKLFLEVDLVGEEGAFLALQTKQGTKIPNNTLSTGTRQLLATAIPIYKFDTKDTVILFDEPERSLFPDIQRELVKYYTGLAPEAQFFFATHSPIIAAAFEPEERFILYFDEDGEVKFRNGVAPIGDDPNDILHDDFGLKEVMLDEGLAAYKRYRNLFVEIKSEKDPDRKKELVVEQAKLGDQYKF